MDRVVPGMVHSSISRNRYLHPGQNKTNRPKISGRLSYPQVKRFIKGLIGELIGSLISRSVPDLESLMRQVLIFFGLLGQTSGKTAARGQNCRRAKFANCYGQNDHNRGADEKIKRGFICQAEEPDEVGIQPEKKRRHFHDTDPRAGGSLDCRQPRNLISYMPGRIDCPIKPFGQIADTDINGQYDKEAFQPDLRNLFGSNRA